MAAWQRERGLRKGHWDARKENTPKSYGDGESEEQDSKMGASGSSSVQGKGEGAEGNEC